jgi:transketolase
VSNKLDNLLVLIDKNGLQGFGNTADILGDTAAIALWQTIGFDVAVADGHDIENLINTRNNLLALHNGKPKVIIAATVKGKGVNYMENKMEWHYLPMNEMQYTEAINNIKTKYNL